VFRALRRAGLAFRRHGRAEGVCADATVPRARLAVFVDGSFWHGWRFPAWAGNLAPYWRDKIARNRARDRRQTRMLRRRGWTVVRVWEHALRRDEAGTVAKIRRALVGAREYTEARA
jgi:DNA mismatch endonuclease (patch repair protein)